MLAEQPFAPTESIGCPTCRARSGKRCTTASEYGRKTVDWYHQSRIDLAKDRRLDIVRPGPDEFVPSRCSVEVRGVVCTRTVRDRRGLFCEGHRSRILNYGDTLSDIPLGKLRPQHLEALGIEVVSKESRRMFSRMAQ